MKSISSVLLPALALLAGCAKHEAAAPSAAASLPAARVHLSPVIAASAPSLTEITGTVRPVQHAMLAAKVMGTITELPVALGQRVSKGDLLLKISAAEINARATQARSQLNQARRDLERERNLLPRGASTAEMVRGLEDRFNMAEAMVAEAEVMLGYTELHAPFDGVVARKFVNAGDLSAPGQPLLELEGSSDFQVEVGIPDALASLLSPCVALACEAGGTGFSATLLELSSASDPATRAVPAKLAVPAGTSVRSGQFVRVLVPGPVVTALLVPAAAVSVSGQMERVFVSGDDQRAGLRLVKTGATREGSVEILSGLSAGELVVVNPPVGLREGQPLEAQP